MKLIIDVGTTNITTCRWNKASLDDWQFFANEQVEYGADILTRLKQDKEKMQEILFLSLNKIIDQYENKYNIACTDIVILGNTVICALFLAKNLVDIRKFYNNKLKIINGEEISFRDVKIFLPPIMDRFVGSDAFSVLVESGMYKRKENIMILDLGTNAELIFGNKDKIYFTSFAGGPAFEGDTISCGSSSMDRAIKNTYVEDGKIKINNSEKKDLHSICATGLVDAIHSFKKLKYLSNNGRLSENKIKIYKDVYINQLDIREIQKSKSACTTSILAIVKKADLRVDKFIITGTFGYYLDIKKAIDIGLLPDIGIDNYFVDQKMVNKGARKICQMKQKEISNIFLKTELFPLETDEYFINNFINNFSFERFYV